MLWAFHRRGQTLHYEIRRGENGAEFELVVYRANGEQTCERFPNSEALNRRTVELQRSLLDDGWFVTDPRR
jgi:hypothetical protein